MKLINNGRNNSNYSRKAFCIRHLKIGCFRVRVGINYQYPSPGKNEKTASYPGETARLPVITMMPLSYLQ